MRLSRSGKCFRNLLLSLLPGFLLAAWLQFPPLTVDGMCRQMGRELLITTPEPIYVVKGNSPRLANFKNTYVVARSGFTLRDAARKWYRILPKDDDPAHSSTLRAEIPVQISLLDASGAVLDTLDLSIDNSVFFLY